MISQLANLNWIGILLAFLAYFFLGYVWYTVLFEKQYKRSLGRDNEILPNKPIFIIGPAVCTLMYVIACSILMYTLNVHTFGGAFEYSLLIGFGFLVSNTVNIAINPNIPRPIYYGVITGTYHLLGIFIASVILVAMK